MREQFEREKSQVLSLVEKFVDVEHSVQLGGEIVAVGNEREATRDQTARR